MPLHDFECEDGHVNEVYLSMAGFTRIIDCPTISCGLKSNIQINKSFHVGVFEPYTEKNFNGKPILVESADHRDALCAEHHLSYDKTDYSRKPVTKAAVEDLDLGTVKTALETGKLPDGTKLELDET